MSKIIGWDIGGAHLKAVLLENDAVLNSCQIACPLWKGLPVLETTMSNVLDAFKLQFNHAQHAVTMTGELVDLFENRQAGVSEIATLATVVLGKNTMFYAANKGFVGLQKVKKNAGHIASTNWHASASLLGLLLKKQKIDQALLVDIGSTTTDITPLSIDHLKLPIHSDYQRLQNDTLVYTGVVRTPVMALAQKLVFDGKEINTMAEYFATMADVYRLTGELDAGMDMADTADGKGKTPIESARRLARMIGCDVDEHMEKWKVLATTCRSLQVAQIKSAVMKHLPADSAMIGAGAGAFLVKTIAKECGHDYFSIEDFLPIMQTKQLPIEICLPAFAVAYLLSHHAN